MSDQPGGYPSGCSTSNIPGNSVRDEFVEKYCDTAFTQLVDEFYEEENEFCRELIMNTEKYSDFVSTKGYELYDREDKE